MYHSHWGLAAAPFRGRLDPKTYHPSPTHEEALARLHFLVEERRRLGLLLGEPGSGKSLALEVFARQLRRAGRPVVEIGLVGLEKGEFLRLLAMELGLNAERVAGTASLWRMLADRIAEHRFQQLETVLLLDDVDQAPQEVFGQLVRLAKFDPSPDSRLTLLLAGNPAGMGRLGINLLELAELRIDLEPWEPADTEGYIRAALAQAGCKAAVFDPAAVARLHELAQGLPRRVIQLADLALLAGAGRGLKQIDAETIDSACQELGVIEV